MANHYSIEEWKAVPGKVASLVEDGAGTYAVLRDLRPTMPAEIRNLWYDPEDGGSVAFNYEKTAGEDAMREWANAFMEVPGVTHVGYGYGYTPKEDCPYIFIKNASIPASSVFGPVAAAAQLKPNFLNRLWGGPNPLAATIAGALLGGGLGYGTGWLAEQLMPKKNIERGYLRNTGGILGALAGAVPGIGWGADNLRTHNWNPSALVSPYPYTQEDIYKSGSFIKDAAEEFRKNASPECLELNELWTKYAFNDAGAMFSPRIPVDQFNRVIWNDLRGYGGGSTSPGLAAATTGLTEAASLSRGGVKWVSPFDIARIGLGAGASYLSSTLVGKTLGALAGLSQPAQAELQRQGTWAGVLQNTVPLLFR